MAPPQELFDLTGKTVIVTGSTRGLGRAMAEGFAAAGATVVVSSRRVEACTEVARDIHNATGADVTGIPCHVGDWDAIPAFVDHVTEVTGGIDVLVNNAGINPQTQTVSDVDLGLWRKIFSVNVEGALRLSQCVAPIMRERGGGSIINIGSMEGYAATGISVAYGASKAALKHLTVSMAQAWAAWGVRVNILSPGPFETEIITVAEEHVPGTLAMLAEKTAQQRIAKPHEIVGPALYLASAASSFVTGDDLTVNGGMRK